MRFNPLEADFIIPTCLLRKAGTLALPTNLEVAELDDAAKQIDKERAWGLTFLVASRVAFLGSIGALSSEHAQWAVPAALGASSALTVAALGRFNTSQRMTKEWLGRIMDGLGERLQGTPNEVRVRQYSGMIETNGSQADRAIGNTTLEQVGYGLAMQGLALLQHPSAWPVMAATTTLGVVQIVKGFGWFHRLQSTYLEKVGLWREKRMRGFVAKAESRDAVKKRNEVVRLTSGINSVSSVARNAPVISQYFQETFRTGSAGLGAMVAMVGDHFHRLTSNVIGSASAITQGIEARKALEHLVTQATRNVAVIMTEDEWDIYRYEKLAETVKPTQFPEKGNHLLLSKINPHRLDNRGNLFELPQSEQLNLDMIIVVQGESGTGKSNLLRYFEQTIRGKGGCFLVRNGTVVDPLTMSLDERKQTIVRVDKTFGGSADSLIDVLMQSDTGKRWQLSVLNWADEVLDASKLAYLEATFEEKVWMGKSGKNDLSAWNATLLKAICSELCSSGYFREDEGVEELVQRPVKQFSDGQKVRAALALALIHHPGCRLLLVDEPFENLRETSMANSDVERISLILQGLVKRGVGVVMTSHASIARLDEVLGKNIGVVLELHDQGLVKTHERVELPELEEMVVVKCAQWWGLIRTAEPQELVSCLDRVMQEMDAFKDRVFGQGFHLPAELCVNNYTDWGYGYGEFGKKLLSFKKSDEMLDLSLWMALELSRQAKLIGDDDHNQPYLMQLLSLTDRLCQYNIIEAQKLIPELSMLNRALEQQTQPNMFMLQMCQNLLYSAGLWDLYGTFLISIRDMADKALAVNA